MLFCQDKEIGVEAMERKRIEYIDWLRIISAIAVIGIHITMTQPNNYSVQEIGKSNYTILTCVYTLIQWAVPVFLMISGKDSGLERSFIRELVNLKEYRL